MPLTLSRALRHTTARHTRARVGPPAAPQGRLLNDGDFTYAGSFQLPLFIGPEGDSDLTDFSFGSLTHRYVGGQLRFFSTAHRSAGARVFEFTPAAGLSTTWPYTGTTATLVRNWGLAPYGGRRWLQVEVAPGLAQWLDEETGDSNELYGLHWDEARQRLYWSYGNIYNSIFPSNPCLGFATLNDAAGTAQAFGPWPLLNSSEKYGRGGCCAIPQAWADAHTGGRSLGVGFGGYFSIIGNGGAGPAFGAVAHPAAAQHDPPANGNAPWPGPRLDDARLIGYPYNSVPYTRPLQGRRPPDTRSRNWWLYGAHGRAAGGGPDTLVFHPRALVNDEPSRANYYAGFYVRLTAGPGAGQERVIQTYDNAKGTPTSRTATVSPPWGTPPTDQTDYVIYSGYAQGGTVNSIRLAASEGAGPTATPGFYVKIVTGTGAGQEERLITAYDGFTKECIVTPAWSTAPDATSTYLIYNPGQDPPNWEPRDGVAYWDYMDDIYQNGIWIEGQNKRGFLIIAALTQGFTWYDASTIWTLGWRDRWMVYDPDVLALAALGAAGGGLDQDQVDPTNSWYQDLPNRYNDPSAVHQGSPDASTLIMPGGLTFDALTNTLYILGLKTVPYGGGAYPAVHAYAVSC